MKMTKNQLADLVTEELIRMVESGDLDEGFLDRLKARGAGVGSKVGSAVKGAGKSLGAKVTGAKAAAVGALGGDAAALRQKQTDQQQAATDIKSAGAGKAEAQKMLSIVKSHLNAFMADLTKLGIDINTPGIKGSLTSLQGAVTGSIAKKAGIKESALREKQ